MYRLLIVDDPESCAAIQSRIDWQGYGFTVVRTANSYVEGIDLALDLHPHLMLLGTGMGAYRGYDLADHLRAVGLRSVFAVMSAEREPELIIQAMRAGAKDFLTKPLDEEELRTFVERVVVNDLGGSVSRGEPVRQDVDPVLHVPYSALSRITNKIILVVRTDYRQSQTLTLIAERMHMSSKYIGRIFLKDTGIKFSEYLMAYRMLEARKLIVSTQEKISVIAGMVGYVQLNNFYIHFRNYFGVSPSALRNFGGAENA
ncbi:MAG: helix-turn-helix domain-containing protein [Oscillospiraceae bacterium]|nr:helix-turn-helix domain-containing protein [Oscillospiraceae bacterium]